MSLMKEFLAFRLISISAEKKCQYLSYVGSKSTLMYFQHKYLLSLLYSLLRVTCCDSRPFLVLTSPHGLFVLGYCWAEAACSTKDSYWGEWGQRHRAGAETLQRGSWLCHGQGTPWRPGPVWWHLYLLGKQRHQVSAPQLNTHCQRSCYLYSMFVKWLGHH